MLKRFGLSFAIFIFSMGAVRAEAPVPYEVAGAVVHEITSDATGRRYKLQVKTPPGYSASENAKRAYPAIYLNDSELFFLVAAGAPLLSYYNGVIEETIIVGVSYAVGEDPIASRQRDLTPVVDESFKNETGGAPAYFEFLRDEAIPLIESVYRTDKSRRTLAGHSLGGTFGAYALLREPDLFASYIIISPALWFGDHAVAAAEERYASTHRALKARVYMAVGDLEGPKGGLKGVDLANDQVAFAARLRSRNYEGLILRDEVLPGVSHSTSFPAALLRALDWMFPPK
jgi:hypothetical protein